MKLLKYFFEFIFIYILFLIFKIIGYKNSSNLGEKIGKFCGDTRTRGHVRSGQHGRRMGPVAVCCCPPPSRDARERARPARPADCRRATTSDTAVGRWI